MKRIILLSIILICTFIQCKKPEEGVKTQVPVAPTNLLAKVFSSTSINLSWTDNSANESGFIIERKADSEAYKTIHSTAANIETFSDTGLNPNNKYNYRIFAFNAAGSSITSSNEASVTTDSVKLVPSVTTSPISSITISTAISGGKVESDGGSAIVSRGVVWSTSTNPTISLGTKTSDTTTSSTYLSHITALAGNTTYYVKAYATNSIGTGYGAELSFKTSIYGLPFVSDTMDFDEISADYAAVYIGPLRSDETSPLISRGVVWSKNKNPTIDLSTKVSSTERGGIKFDMTGLTAKQTYYVREYATNIVGTSYGHEANFTSGVNQQNPVIGEYYRGGTIFYILKPGDIGYDPNINHGLIACSDDAYFKEGNNYQPKYSWGDSIKTQATGISIGTGKTNTNLMISILGTDYHYSAIGATKDTYMVFQYSDWYLPSKIELMQMYSARSFIRGIKNLFYWSSSEVTNLTAYCLDFGSGNEKILDKTGEYNVRAIRSF